MRGRRRFVLSAAVLLFAAARPVPAQWLHAAPGNSAVTVRPQIVRTVPHDPSAFTQGLLFHDGLLYESTGLVGKSSLRRIDPRSGEALWKNNLRGGEFAEGIAILGHELVQLTWKGGTAIRYELPTLRGDALPPFHYKGEGWGLTNDATHFIMSNGSDSLYFRDKRFEPVRAVAVTRNGRPQKHLNELEYTRGYVYANVWYQNFIVEISAESGTVKRVIDCAGLLRAERPLTVDNVLNGIAYDEREDEWYLTGKNWKSIFVVKIPKPSP
ncbi:MAG: glutaminyl-peptide cyclotransferase [Chitinispirillales bacterium]|nr:glutaminyl-peptide cyclotransferase [Chitinispirillales bacterium]